MELLAELEAAIGATQSVIVLRGGYLNEVNNRCLFSVLYWDPLKGGTLKRMLVVL